ncbi:MAG: PKD domain-containing protein [Bacteroidia bacterium]
MKKIILTCFISIASILQTSAQCLMYPVLLSQRVPQSSLIVEGKVINQQCFWNSNHDKIYTSNLVEVYKTFKNASPAYIEIITEGGIVGNDKHVFEPTLELEVGDVGVFTLNQNSQLSQFGKQTYDAYASAQGFIKYDVVSNIASEPFNTYQNASSTLYNTIAQYTGANYVQVKPINPFQISTQNINAVQNVAAITSFTPTTITAGTFSVLTINGTGFGATATPSLITFKNADDGGATTISPIANQIVSWTNTQIQVMVPSKAGTGVIGVNGSNSSTQLTIPYSHINVTNANIVYNTKHINQGSGGYVWTYNTNFNTNAPAKAAFQRSLQSWRCATYINWPTASTTSTISASANDGVNIVTFNSGLGAGILGQCGSYFSGCTISGVTQFYVSELDIQFANTPGGLTWQYGTAAPTASQYDFESVTVHELGHGHQLGHVIKTTDLMHYALSNGQSKRTLNTDDLNGGLAVMARNAQTGGTCNLPLMVPLTAGNCALGAPTANFSANRTTVCPGQTVVFTDLSTGTPTVLAWTFAGGTPSTSAVSSPTITYNTPGTYSVQLVATNANGSSTYSVAAYINVVSPATLPLVQDFQSATYPPTNWYINDAGNDNVKWKLATNAGYNSTQSTVFDNWTDSITPTKDELKTYVNLSGFSTAKMTFYRSYSQTFASPYVDTLQIGVSTNCGTSTTYPYLKGGSQLASATTATSSAPFTPTATAQWAKDSIDLTPYVGQANVMIAFINRGHYGDAIYLDNINITGVAATTPTAAITSASTGCTGTPITLTDASTGGPTSWTWTMAGGTPSVATTQNTSVTYSTAGVKTITLTVANGTGTTTATKTITITATPTVAASVTNTTICSGGSVVETLTGATTYTWLPSGSGTTSTLTPTSTTIYTITGSTGGCVSAVRNVTVTVTPNPTVNIVASSSTICAGQTATLTASGATAYAWLPGAQTTTVITVTPTITTTYTVNGSVGTCYGTKTISINVTSTPTVASSITNTTICSGTSVIANVTGATTYTWLPSGSGNTSTLTPSSTTVYTVTGSNGSCVSAPKNFTINVTTTPTVNITASSSTVCAGQTVTLTASGATAYSWLPGAQTTTVITVNPTSTTSYTVNGANGTCYGTKTITINVSSTPTIATSITNTTICNGKSVIASVTGATSYTWSPSGSGNTSTLTPSSTTVYTITGSNGSCVSSPKTFTVNVNSNPVVSNTTTNVTCFGLCNGSTTITATGGSAPYVYTLVQGTPICTSTTCNNLCAGAYTINVTDINGCTGTSNITISQPTQLVATISNTNATCSSCTDGAASVLASGGTPAYTYSWTPLALTTPNASSLAVGCYTATVVDANGCVASATTCISFGTGIYENQTADIFSIYPNPTKGIITITTSSIFEKVDIEITNTLGQTVKTETLKNIQQTTVDMSNLSKGIYYIKVSSPEGAKLSKLILE